MGKIVVDLSCRLEPATPIVKGDKQFSYKNIPKFARRSSYITCSAHGGTHVDAPYHIVNTGLQINEIPLDRFFGNTVLIDLSPKSLWFSKCLFSYDTIIISESLEYNIIRFNRPCNDLEYFRELMVPDDSIILFYTGFDRTEENMLNFLKYGRTLAESWTCIDYQVMRWFREFCSPKAIGVDTPSVDPTFDKQRRMESNHTCFLDHQIPIFENLQHLDRLQQVCGRKTFQFYGVPLKMPGLEASPIRAFAVVERG